MKLNKKSVVLIRRLIVGVVCGILNHSVFSSCPYTTPCVGPGKMPTCTSGSPLCQRIQNECIARDGTCYSIHCAYFTCPTSSRSGGTKEHSGTMTGSRATIEHSGTTTITPSQSGTTIEHSGTTTITPTQ